MPSEKFPNLASSSFSISYAHRPAWIFCFARRSESFFTDFPFRCSLLSFIFSTKALVSVSISSGGEEEIAVWGEICPRDPKAASEGLDSSNAAVKTTPSQRAPAGSRSSGRQRTAAASSSGGGGGAVLVGQQLCCRRAAAAQPLDSSGDQLQILAAATSSSISTTSDSRAYRRLVDSGSLDFGWGSSHGVPGNGGQTSTAVGASRRLCKRGQKRRQQLRLDDKVEYVLDKPIGVIPNKESLEFATFDVEAHQKQIDNASDAQCVMLSSMSLELQRQHEHMLPYDMLKHLESLYASQAQTMEYEILRDLFKCKLHDGGKVSEHVLKMIGLIERLASIGTVLPANVSTNLTL
ncbi:hypothetical protein SASPL_135331 [Salvia splendens]|uniref:Uncharacterized protein n=1 Tax=Salvia splendens TaxID=180675 RepID=A0A8X8WYL1_SALSN|nr:hypothetical protein SASPL_135331 [Salvia splendens]